MCVIVTFVAYSENDLCILTKIKIFPENNENNFLINSIKLCNIHTFIQQHTYSD